MNRAGPMAREDQMQPLDKLCVQNEEKISKRTPFVYIKKYPVMALQHSTCAAPSKGTGVDAGEEQREQNGKNTRRMPGILQRPERMCLEQRRLS